MKRILAILLALLPTTAQSQVPEIPNHFLQDIARVVPTPQGPIIEYNPMICAQVGPLICEWFRAHEYGHIYLNHVTRFGYSHIWPQEAEAQADCFAAENSRRHVNQAAIAFFESVPTYSWMHGSGWERADRIRRCGPW